MGRAHESTWPTRTNDDDHGHETNENDDVHADDQNRYDRRRFMPFLGVGVWLLGVPSALSQKVFSNQDFVWSVALMVSGLLFAIVALKYGVTRFREDFVNSGNQDLRIGAWWDWAIRLVVVEAVVLVVWWFWQVRNSAMFAPDGLGLLLLEWAVVAAAFILANRWIVKRLDATAAKNSEG